MFAFSQSFDTEIKSNLLEYYEFRNHTFQLNRWFSRWFSKGKVRENALLTLLNRFRRTRQTAKETY